MRRERRAYATIWAAVALFSLFVNLSRLSTRDATTVLPALLYYCTYPSDKRTMRHGIIFRNVSTVRGSTYTGPSFVRNERGAWSSHFSSKYLIFKPHEVLICILIIFPQWYIRCWLENKSTFCIESFLGRGVQWYTTVSFLCLSTRRCSAFCARMRKYFSFAFFCWLRKDVDYVFLNFAQVIDI